MLLKANDSTSSCILPVRVKACATQFSSAATVAARSMDSMWIESWRAFRWLEDKDEVELVVADVVELLLLVPDVERELVGLTVEQEERM